MEYLYNKKELFAQHSRDNIKSLPYARDQSFIELQINITNICKELIERIDDPKHHKLKLHINKIYKFITNINDNYLLIDFYNCFNVHMHKLLTTNLYSQVSIYIGWQIKYDTCFIMQYNKIRQMGYEMIIRLTRHFYYATLSENYEANFA